MLKQNLPPSVVAFRKWRQRISRAVISILFALFGAAAAFGWPLVLGLGMSLGILSGLGVLLLANGAMEGQLDRGPQTKEDLRARELFLEERDG